MKLDRIEEGIQRSIVELWRTVGRDDAIMLHVPNEFADSKNKRGIGTGLGCWWGCPDLIFISQAWRARILFMEVKKPGGKLNPNQKIAADTIMDFGHSYALVDDLDGAKYYLGINGFLKCNVVVA